MEGVPLTLQCLGEFLGTALLVLLGDGVCAGVTLAKSKAKGAGWVAIAIAWGFAVAIAVYAVAKIAPGHLNPAVTLGMAIAGSLPWSSVVPYWVAQIAGGFVGGVLLWLHYYPHWAEEKDPNNILGCFCTAPAIRSYGWNFVSEFVGTFVLVICLLAFGNTQFSAGLNPIVVGILIMVIGFSLGGTTGYAINPARDLGPRLALALCPVANKKGADWAYAWVPILGPLAGGACAALFFALLP